LQAPAIQVRLEFGNVDFVKREKQENQ